MARDNEHPTRPHVPLSRRYQFLSLPLVSGKGQRWIGLFFLGLILLASSGCGNGATGKRGGVPYLPPAFVDFASSVPYEQALQIITNLGLQPGFDCTIWQPMGQRETFSQTHHLFVMEGYLSAANDWLGRLQKTPGVVKVTNGFRVIAGTTPSAAQTANGLKPYTCPVGEQAAAEGGPLPPGAILTLTSAQAGDYAQITFTAPTSYDSALYDVSNVGLPLADPCYEQELEQGGSPAWHPQGQESSFATTHTLTMRTNKGVTSSLWQQQLRAISDIAAIKTPLTPQC